MTHRALDRHGVEIDAERIAPDTWAALKASAQLGDFVMDCCKTPAVLKTSVLGRHFFAHHNDECATAPETEWHKEGKAAILDACASLGLAARDEVPGGVAGDEWKADTLIDFRGRPVAIELQRSYQTVEEYIARQQRYARYGVAAFWLTRRSNLTAITKVTGRMRMRSEWGGGFPPGMKTFMPLLQQFPVSVLELGVIPHVWHVGNTRCSIEDWIQAIQDSRYVYRDGTWDLCAP
jgi:hypothetical protein